MNLFGIYYVINHIFYYEVELCSGEHTGLPDLEVFGFKSHQE